MADNQDKSSAKIVMIGLVIAFIGLVIWKFPALRGYSYSLVASGAIVPMPEYHVSDIPNIAEAATTNRAVFDQRYARQTLSGELIFAASQPRGSSAFLIKATGPDAVTVECGMNKFRAAASKDALDSLKPGDLVRVKGVIGAESAGRTISLSDGCTVEKAAAQSPAAQPPAK